MAPEQFRDPKSVDVRADIYSFGIVLFEMITGELPFQGRSIEVLDDQHSLHRPARSCRRSPPGTRSSPGRSTPSSSTAFKKEPGDRFHSVAELRQAIKQVAAQFPGDEC